MILVDLWEFSSHLRAINFLLVLACLQIKLNPRVLSAPFFRQKRVLHPELSYVVLAQAPPKHDDLLAFLVELLPCVGVVEAIMVWQLEPLHLGRILASPLHDAVPGWLVLV